MTAPETGGSAGACGDDQQPAAAELAFAESAAGYAQLRQHIAAFCDLLAFGIDDLYGVEAHLAHPGFVYPALAGVGVA